jgi:Cu-Zn family superoxide dismutase
MSDRKRLRREAAMTTSNHLAWATLALCLFAAGCGGGNEVAESVESSDSAVPGRTATATLRPASGSNVSGTVTFTEESGGVRIFAMLSGLEPGEHGFHIHVTGDCSAPDASSAGGHFNPGNTAHAGPDAAERHAGDFGNITADEAGNATFERVDTHIALDDGPNSVIGRAVVVHADADDMSSQPAGNAGARIACGSIEGAGY